MRAHSMIAVLVLVFCCFATVLRGQAKPAQGDLVTCGNLIYAGSKTSKCFADYFLKRLARNTNIQTKAKFTPVKLSSKDLYKYPFCVMTGEGRFTLTEQERANLQNYLRRGGFLLASAGCSNPEWVASFRREMKRIFPKEKLETIPMSHPLFHTVYEIKSVETGHGNHAKLEGLHLGRRLAVVFSADGLNDTEHAAEECCCCEGDEIVNADMINANALAYALLH